MAFNKNEVLLDRVRSLTAHDLETNELLFRLTSLEDPSLACTAEGEEVVDAIGALITTLYRAKKATFSASNSLISLDLAAAQYGTKKEVVEEGKTITDYTYEIIKVVEGEPVKLANKPNVDSVKYIYTIEDGQIGTAFKAGATASATEFVVSDEGEITLPTGVDAAKIYVEYTYENANAMRVVNKASNFPSACSVVIYAYFKDVCNENKVYSGKIICPKAKLNQNRLNLLLLLQENVHLSLKMMRDYCSSEDEDELFSIVISQ